MNNLYKLLIGVKKIFLLMFFTTCVYSQVNSKSTFTITYKNQVLTAYSDLKYANKIHPDSVIALSLFCTSFNDFPKEILKFKNLVYLDIGNYKCDCDCDSLTKKELRRKRKIARGLKKSKPYSQHSHTMPEYVPKDYFREKKNKIDSQ